MYSYEFVQRKHKDKVFAFLILFEYGSGLSYSTRYYASKGKIDKKFIIIQKDKYKEDLFYWQNIELLDLNNDNIREIALNYENGYPKHSREVYNFSTDSIAPIILKYPYNDGILTCIDSAKNLYFHVSRNNVSGMWDSELFVIHKDFLKGDILGTAKWDKFMCDYCFYIRGKHKENPYTTYFDSDSKSIIDNFHPKANHWNSKENIEFMKNAYLKMLKEFKIEY